jgi:hypothetical protein
LLPITGPANCDWTPVALPVVVAVLPSVIVPPVIERWNSSPLS